MATTRIIPMHINKGQTIAQMLTGSTGYGLNPEKTGQGAFVTAYACDRHTADAEFLLAQREYAQLTGRAQDGGVILYQIRQSFKPGEITPEEANRAGYELASRFLKGKHAFFVCTHTDKKHIHNHIYWNAVTLDYKHKFRDFLGSWRAVSRLSDLICLEHQLSVVQNPKRYTHSHYGKWLGNRAKISHRELARIAIDDALSKHPHTFDAFLELLQQSGYTVRRGKHLTLCKEGQKNIRFDSLKKECTEDAIRAVISGKKQRQPREQKPVPAQQNVQKILDMAAIHAANKGYAYVRWATNFNTKAASKSLLYLQTVCGGRYDVLTQKADEASAHYRELLDQMNAAQKRLTQIDVLRRHVLNYARTRDIFQQYKASGYSKKFLNEHQQETGTGRQSVRLTSWGCKSSRLKSPSTWNTVSCLRRKKRLMRRTATRGNRRGNCSCTGKICVHILPRRRLRQERSGWSRTRDNPPAVKHRRCAAIRFSGCVLGLGEDTSQQAKRGNGHVRFLAFCKWFV